MPTDGWPQDGGPTAALAFSAHARYRGTLSAWAGDQGAASTLWAGARSLPEELDRLGDDVLLVPIAVTGAARSEGGIARVLPVRRRQVPRGHEVLVGAAATLGELRARAADRGAKDFAGFVSRQGTIALDRAERAVAGDRYKVARQVIDDIASTARFDGIVADLARSTGRPEADIRAEALDCLHEMTAEETSAAIDAWNRLGRWASRAYSLDVDHEAIEPLRELGRRHSLVFLPNHRSYLDPLVLRTALEQHGFPPNHVLGGVNLAFWPLGTIARRTGVVFIRREFRDAVVYRAMLKELLAYLVRKRFNLEWYMEGGRTRNGKLRPPRYGILSYLVDAFAEGGADDVYLVPVAIVYDQQHEIEAISAEETGGRKVPESIGWLVRFARSQSRTLGRAHLRFGEPLSLQGALAANRTDPDAARLEVPRIAFEVAHRINLVTPISPQALVTFALLGNEDRAITVAEGRAILEPLLAYVRRRGLPLTQGIDVAEDDGALADAIRTLEREGVLERFAGGDEAVYRIAPDRQHEAGYYRNTIIHFFITRAIVEAALVKVAEEDPADAVDAVWQEARRIRDLLKFEFFFADTRAFAADVRQESEIALPGWEDSQLAAADLLPLMSGSRLLLAHRVLQPFLEAYAVVAHRLAAQPADEPVDVDAFLDGCLGVAHQRWLQQSLHSPESISRDLFRGAVKLAENRGLLEPGPPDLAARRQGLAAELDDVIRRVRVVRRLDGPSS
jgi:glycerol-3-phosphate O-acyltransferase